MPHQDKIETITHAESLQRAFTWVFSWARWIEIKFRTNASWTPETLVAGCGPGQPPTTDEGCNIDPHGGATAQGEAPIQPPTTDEGCIIDPHGGCRPGS